MFKKVLESLLLLILLSGCALSAPSAAEAPLPGVAVEYFNNLTLRGNPSVVQVEQAIRLSLETGDYPPAQGIGGDFSARWSGVIIPPVSGSYKFSVLADDGARFTFAGSVLSDDWSSPTLAAHETSVAVLEAGTPYPFTLEMYDANGSAVAQLSWQRDALPYEVVPATAFAYYESDLPDATPYKRADNEICIPDLSDPDAQYTAGTPVPPGVASPGSLADVQQLALTEANLVGTYAPGTVPVVVVPVGYTPEQITTQVAGRVALLQDVVNQLGMGASYAYINVSVPVQVNRYGDLLRIDEDQLREATRQAVAVSRAYLVVFDVNTAGRGYSNWIDNTPYNIVTAEGYLYSNVHELAHAEGLDDGYADSTYNYGEFLYGSTEMFLVDTNGTPFVHNESYAAWIAANNPVFEDAGFVCLGDKLVRMKGEAESIMNAYWHDDEIISNGVVNTTVFTDFQRWRMATGRAEILQTP